MGWHGGDGKALDDDTKSEHSKSELGASGSGSGSDDIFLSVNDSVYDSFISIYSSLLEGVAKSEVAGFVQEVQ